MKTLYYTFKALMRGRNSVVIKCVSLTLGLFVGILLFAKIAEDLRYDTGYNDYGRLCQILSIYNIQGLTHEPGKQVFGPVAAAAAEGLSDAIESSTTTMPPRTTLVVTAGRQFEATYLYGDTLFFHTMGIPVLEGNVSDLNSHYNVFVSDTFAKRLYGDENPIGQTFTFNTGEKAFTVKGIFKEVPENNSIRPEVVLSWEFHRASGIYFGFDGGDRYYGFLRLREGVDLETLNKRLNALVEQYRPSDPENTGYSIQFRIEPIRSLYLHDSEVRLRLAVMSILGFALLLIAALNYVLISIASLTTRAKSIGVHKCSGASGRQIFGMFMIETAVVTLISLIAAILLIGVFHSLIEDLLDSNIRLLFTPEILWVPALVVVALFIIAGVLPGNLFARIPVSQVFRRYTESRQSWKRPLLFVQFTGVSFILGLLCVVLLQYQKAINYDVGYQPEGLACAIEDVNEEVLRTVLTNLPAVEEVAFSGDLIGSYNWSGEGIYGTDVNKTLFSTRINFGDSQFLPMLGLRFKEGRNMERAGEAVVNEEFVRLMHWTDSPIGKQSGLSSNFGQHTIVGVVEDFVISSLFTPVQPVLFLRSFLWRRGVTVRLKAPYDESLHAVNEAVKEAFPTSILTFEYLPDTIKSFYAPVRRFRDMVWIAFIATLLISLMGLLGYTNDEVRRRSKEIAIRKVNGADASQIIRLLLRGIVWIAVPAVIIGAFCAYVAGNMALEIFVRDRMELHGWLFAGIALLVVLIIFATITLKSWRIANDNPVDSLKNE
ncbi:MAG: ABC transporter permease [Prevotellaceae bacterium]|jgi:putative ABC transport system permease protein|nr:ABC transporter permease [Prevotellaceae bacterium]